MNGTYDYGMWVVVAFNIGLFLFFIGGFIAPTGRAEWRTMGVLTAFLVALFTEMYGFPLTIYLLSGWLGEAYPVLEPFSHKYGHLWVVVFGGSDLAWAVVMGLSLLFMFTGYVLLSKGWRQVHQAHGRLVMDGVYAYVRHPQYTGLFLFIVGFLIQWPTLLTVLMTPILVFAYFRLAQSEERHMLDQFGQRYTEYVRHTPGFFPPLHQWKPFLLAPVGDDMSEQGADKRL